MPADLDLLTVQLLDAARKAGADTADAIAIDGTSLSIDVLKGRLENVERSEGVEVGLRVLIGKRQACVASSDVGDAAIARMAEQAVAMAREAPEDSSAGLADPSQLARNWDLARLDLDDPAPEPSPADLQEDARRAEAAALAVPGVSQTQSAGASYGRRRVHLAATNGFSGGYARSQRSTSCVAITGSGTAMERDYFGETRTYQTDLPDPETIGRIAGERTAARAGARKPPSGRFPVVFDERIAASLVGHLLAAANGSAIVRGSSWLRDAMGEQILPAGLDVVEDPLRPRIGGSRPFDGEGLPVARRAVVADGRLTSWTLDLATARRLGLESTGNASRGTSAPPSPSVTNIALTQGAQTRDDLLADMGTGLLVTSLIGSSINPTTGDYSRGASGFWVVNGQIAYPVNECTIAGNLREMLRSIRPANDARSHLSHVVPSILVEGLTLAGE
ncbi:TldD/PmbA family protein [Palleronia sp. KMU-117]|uniref:TldD/PmbA family protein n=1 Tax=Palleronia sp. KMU-117 TaxID=3434108 RepID=UPI003D75AA42